MPGTTDWFVIVNPTSGSGRALRRWLRLARELHAARVPFEAVFTAAPAAGRALAAAAWRNGWRRFLAVGGDGSLHDLVNGLADCGPAALSTSTVGVAPFGTGNDWARQHRMPRAPWAIAAVVAAGHGVPHDLGELRFAATGVPPCWFINVAGAGLDAYVIPRLPRRVPGWLAYGWATLVSLRSFRAPDFTITAAGIDWRGRRLVVFAAIGAYCGGGMYVAPQTLVDDGLAELLAIADLSLGGVLRRLPRLFNGRIGRDAAVVTARVDRLAIAATPPCGVEADGQHVGCTPVEIVIHRRALTALVPGPAARRR